MAQILLLKAKLRGDTETGDLFAMPVPVKGHMRGQTYVAPTTAIRHKAAPAPALVRMTRHAPTETITSRSKMVPADQVEAERARGWRTGDEQRAEPDPAERLAQIDRHIEARAKAGEPPLPKLAEMRDKLAGQQPLSPREQLERLRANIVETTKRLASRVATIVDNAETVARSKEPGRGSFFGRGATTWTRRQEDWFQDEVRLGIANPAHGFPAELQRLDRLLATEAKMTAKLRLNEPWGGAEPTGSLADLRAMVANPGRRYPYGFGDRFPSASSEFNRRHAEAYDAREAIHAKMATAAWEQVEALADGARALSDQMEELARDHQAKLAARAGLETSGDDVQRELEDMRARLARYDARGVSKEPLAAIYRARLGANPEKWKPGQGVSYGVVAGGRYAQRNRGFRVVGVDPAGLRLAVRQVADTGFADARPGAGRDQWVWMGDAKRDTAHDL